MNQSPLTKVLLVVLALTAVTAPILCAWYISKAREFRRLQMEINYAAFRQQRFALIVNEAFEYSKRNKAIDPILQAFVLKTNAPATGLAAPTR